LPGDDAGVSARRISDSPPGSAMKLRFAILAVFLGLCALPAFSQGCVMCYSSAAGSSKEGQNAISRAVLVLLLPPVAFMRLGAGMVVRYSKKRDEEQESDGS